MRKTMFAALCIFLMLFAFASCSNDSGKPGFTGDASEIAEALDPAKLVGDVLKSDAENVDVEYKLIQGGASSSAAKATAGSATLQATVTFDGYKVPNTSYVITDGTLVYAFEGTVSAEGKFTASSAATVKTGSKLIVDTDKGNAEVAISEVKASVNAFTADVSKAGSDGVLPADTSISVNVTVDEDIKVSVGDKDVTVKPEEPAPEPEPEPTIKTIGTEAELREAAENGSGEYTLTADIKGLTSQVSIKAPITINGAGHTISAATPITEADKATASIILIEEDNVVLKDLSVNGTREYTPRQDWQEGEFGIKVWNAEGVVLEDVKVSSVNAGIQVNSAVVTIKGTENELSNNNWGGIGVTTDTSETLKPGKLVIAAGTKIACTDEQSPVVWTESTGTVDDKSGLISFEVTSNDESQTWYITESQEGKPVDQRPVEAAKIVESIENFIPNFAKVIDKNRPEEGSGPDDINSQEFIQTIDESKTDNAEEAYVEFGNFDSVDSVTLLGNKYTADSEFSISVGMNVFYQDVIFKVEEGKLLINKAMLVFAMLNGDTISINGIEYSGYGIDKDSVIPGKPSTVTYDNQQLTAEGDVYTVPLKDTVSQVFYGVDGVTEGDYAFFITTKDDLVTGVSISMVNGQHGSYLLPYGQNINDYKNREGEILSKTLYIYNSSNELSKIIEANFEIAFADAADESLN